MRLNLVVVVVIVVVVVWTRYTGSNDASWPLEIGGDVVRAGIMSIKPIM